MHRRPQSALTWKTFLTWAALTATDLEPAARGGGIGGSPLRPVPHLMAWLSTVVDTKTLGELGAFA
jgi:hypothetical protein